MLDDVKKYSERRHDFIDENILKFFKRVRGTQAKLSSQVIDEFIDLLDVENGRIKTSTTNRKRINQSDFFNKFAQGEGVSLLDNLVGRMLKLLGLNKDYFKLFRKDINTLDKRVTKAILDSYGFDGKKYTKNGLLYLLVKDATIEQTTKGLAIGAINRGASLKEFRSVIKDYVLGNDKRLGAWESHFKRESFDIFQEVDREASNLFRNELKMRHAIYQGGKVGGTRSFCASRDGNVYTEDEILSWNNQSWQGKKQGNSILRDAGGYNCRHTFDWISEELYNELK